MKRKLLLVLLIASISSGVFALTTLANSNSGCAPHISVNSTERSYSFSLPIRLVQVGLTVEIQLKKDLKIGIDCDCDPCCQAPDYQYAALDIKGMAGNNVIWRGNAYNVLKGEVTPSPNELCSVSAQFERKAGSWLPTLGGSLFGISAKTTYLHFDVTPTCECRWLMQKCMKNTPPYFLLPHEPLVITPGSTITFTVHAKDQEGYLDHFVPGKGPGLLPIKMDGQKIDGGVGQATFTLSYTEGMTDGKVRIGVYDKCTKSDAISIPVVVDHPPVLTLRENTGWEDTGWEGGAYIVRFNVSDPDCKGPFAGGDSIQLKVKATGGSEGHSWPSYGIGCSGAYGVEFIPDQNTDEPQSVKITATDSWGVSSSLTVNIPNHDPVFSPSSLCETKQVYVHGGGGGLLFTMEPSWAHLGCLSVTDPDGDDLSIHIGSTPRYGTAGVMVSGDNGHYNVTPTYQLSNETMREIHQSRDGLVDTFTVSTKPTQRRSCLNIPLRGA